MTLFHRRIYFSMRKKLVFVTIILLAAVLLSGCTGALAWPGLSASEKVAYLANTNAVHAIDLKTGSELWNFSGEKSGFSLFNTNPSLFVTTPVITQDGLVIVLDSGNKHVMYALDPNDIDQKEKTPNVEWKFTEVDGHWIAAPLVVGNRLFAPNANGKVYVLDLHDGKSEKQAIRVIDPFFGSDGQSGRLWAQPVSDGNRIFLTSLDHSVFAIDMETYEILWHEDLGGAVPGGAALGSDGMLYVGSLAKQLEKFDPVTGAHEPVLDTKGWIWGTPVADGDNLYFSDMEGYFYSYNTKDQKLNWEPVKPDSAITASPLVLGDRVLIATESGNIYSVDGEGRFVLWYDEPNADGKAYTTPVSAGGYVLAAYLESDYYLLALNEEGFRAWTYPAK
jgi:outer membrane protein assembly factor BamB